MPEEWNNLAAIPTDPTEFPDASLIPLMEHHIAPIKSKAHYFSEERRKWVERFSVP